MRNTGTKYKNDVPLPSEAATTGTGVVRKRACTLRMRLFGSARICCLTAQLVFVKGLQHDHLRNIFAPHEALHTFAGNRMML